jgi:hypothetical protein
MAEVSSFSCALSENVSSDPTFDMTILLAANQQASSSKSQFDSYISGTASKPKMINVSPHSQHDIQQPIREYINSTKW